jgi:hypothetical protein
MLLSNQSGKSLQRGHNLLPGSKEMGTSQDYKVCALPFIIQGLSLLLTGFIRPFVLLALRRYSVTEIVFRGTGTNAFYTRSLRA